MTTTTNHHWAALFSCGLHLHLAFWRVLQALFFISNPWWTVIQHAHLSKSSVCINNKRHSFPSCSPLNNEESRRTYRPCQVMRKICKSFPLKDRKDLKSRLPSPILNLPWIQHVALYQKVQLHFRLACSTILGNNVSKQNWTRKTSVFVPAFCGSSPITSASLSIPFLS